mmetsp:Transcript_2879/g.5580  ORF Transcript_2879/g.5580 Transcript_2879/m.5580 type:complete len:177 (+) Transcript_2879:1470-2000(+)
MSWPAPVPDSEKQDSISGTMQGLQPTAFRLQVWLSLLRMLLRVLCCLPGRALLGEGVPRSSWKLRQWLQDLQGKELVLCIQLGRQSMHRCSRAMQCLQAARGKALHLGCTGRHSQQQMKACQGIGSLWNLRMPQDLNGLGSHCMRRTCSSTLGMRGEAHSSRAPRAQGCPIGMMPR